MLGDITKCGCCEIEYDGLDTNHCDVCEVPLCRDCAECHFDEHREASFADHADHFIDIAKGS